jgi:hypothetical protein
MLQAKCINNIDPRSDEEYKELVVGSFYNVEEVSMGQSNTSIGLYGLRYGFNSVMFEFYKDGKEHDIFRDPDYNPYLNLRIIKG